MADWHVTVDGNTTTGSEGTPEDAWREAALTVADLISRGTTARITFGAEQGTAAIVPQQDPDDPDEAIRVSLEALDGLMDVILGSTIELEVRRPRRRGRPAGTRTRADSADLAAKIAERVRRNPDVSTQELARDLGAGWATVARHRAKRSTDGAET